jgi:CheY-like chemotaxis protein
MLMLNNDLSAMILDSLSAHIAILDNQGTILTVNSAWQRFAAENGNPPPSSVGLGANYFDVLTRTQGRAHDEALAVLQGLREVRAGLIAEYTHEYCCDSDSERRWFLLRATRLGNGGGLVTTHERTTERKLLELVSHELRQPLNAILGWTQILHADTLPPERVKHGLEVIQQNVRTQARMISDLLDSSRSAELRAKTVTLRPSLLSQATSASLPRNSEQRPPQIPPQVLSGLKILIVDDEPEAREFALWALCRHGAQTRAASSACEALIGFQEWNPDVLVSDIGMPEGDGCELLRRIRTLEQERGGRIVAVAMTAFARPEDRESCRAAGFAQHLSKPIEADALVRAVLQGVGRNPQTEA